MVIKSYAYWALKHTRPHPDYEYTRTHIWGRLFTFHNTPNKQHRTQWQWSEHNAKTFVSKIHIDANEIILKCVCVCVCIHKKRSIIWCSHWKFILFEVEVSFVWRQCLHKFTALTFNGDVVTFMHSYWKTDGLQISTDKTLLICDKCIIFYQQKVTIV